MKQNLGEKILLHTHSKDININMITFKEYSALAEAVYPGNIGMMELVQFFKKADPETTKIVKKLIATKKNREAWNIIQKTVGVKLDPSAFK